jgi:hypothetical protein
MKSSSPPFAAFAGLSAIAMLVVSCGANKAPKTVEPTPVPLTTCEVTLPATTDLEKQAPQKIVFEENRALHSDAEKADGFKIRTLNSNEEGPAFKFTLPIKGLTKGPMFMTAGSYSVTRSLLDGHYEKPVGSGITVTGDVSINQLKNKKLSVFTDGGEFFREIPIICSEGR